MDPYDPVPDAVEWLGRHSPIQRHAVARLLDVDGAALPILRWLVDRPDCDRATAAMIFWRVRGLAPIEAQADLAERRALLEAIAANARNGRYGEATIAWDGIETWECVSLVGAPPVDPVLDIEAPDSFAGPFGPVRPEPGKHAFFDSDYGDDDIFDSLWRTLPDYVAMADWLVGKPEPVWIAAVEDLRAGHNEAIYEWMLRWPECPAGVAAAIADEGSPVDPVNLFEDFDYWCASTDLSGLVPRPREAAVAEWRRTLASIAASRARDAEAARERARPAGWLETLVYGGKFSGAPAQLDRAWRGLLVLTLAGAALLFGLLRIGAPLALGFWAFLGLVALVSGYLAAVEIGKGRMWRYWTGLAALAIAGTFLFRWIDKGLIG